MLIASVTPCNDAQMMEFYRASSPLRLIVLSAKSKVHITARQHLKIQTTRNDIFDHTIRDLVEGPIELVSLKDAF